MRTKTIFRVASFVAAFAITHALRSLPKRRLFPLSRESQELSAVPGMVDALSKHGMTVCSCGAPLAYCACPECLANGQKQTVVFKDACSICMQRIVSAKLGPVLEIGADQVLITQGGRVMGVKAFSASVPLANLRALLDMADARGFPDNTQIGMLVREAQTLSAPKEVALGATPDGNSRLVMGSCALCLTQALLDGEYCIACALEMRAANDE